MNKHLLLFSYAFPPKNVVGSLRPYRLCRYLPDHNWLPTVLTERIDQRSLRSKLSMAGISPDIHIHRIHKLEPIKLLSKSLKWIKESRHAKAPHPAATISKQGPPVLSYPQTPPKTGAAKIKMMISDLFENPDPMVLWSFFAFLKGASLLMKKDVRYHLILSTSPPHSSQIFGCLLAKAFGLPHIMDLRDPWTDISRGYQTPFRSRLERAMENFVINYSACIISSTNTYTEQLRKRYPDIPENRFLTITNSFEEKKFNSITEIPNERFVISYLGIFYPKRDPYCFFRALKAWLDHYPERRNDLIFRIIGDSDPTTNNIINILGISDIVEITGRVDHEKAIQLTKSSDLLLIATGTGQATPRGWIPSKLFEYLACRKPILANIPLGDASQIIQSSNSGYVVHTDSVSEIFSILDQEYSRKKSSENSAVDFFQDEAQIMQYSSKTTIQQFAQAFDNAIIQER